MYLIELEIEKSTYSNVIEVLNKAQINVAGANVNEITNTTGKQTYNA